VAVRNLLENSLRHGGGAVALRLHADAGQLVMSVDDEGAGVPLEVAAHLAQHGGSLLVRTDGHARFGLAIARAVAEAHGGRLSVTARAGRGSTVSIAVPCVAGKED
jgi:signal transduction histidine kinase